MNDNEEKGIRFLPPRHDFFSLDAGALNLMTPGTRPHLEKAEFRQSVLSRIPEDVERHELPVTDLQVSGPFPHQPKEAAGRQKFAPETSDALSTGSRPLPTSAAMSI